MATAKKAPLKTNKEWHANNRMPKNATLQQRIEWHLLHTANCQCRPMPDKLKEEMRKEACSNWQDF